MANASSLGYDGFAPYYDLYWAEGYLRDFEEGFAETILPLVPPGARVLDLCCGTGRLVGWLCERGFDVTGLDSSERMLEVARKNAPDAEMVHANAQSFALNEPVDLVVSTFDSMNHLATLDELESVFRSVHGALSSDGLFCFDFNTEEGFECGGDETHAAMDDDHVCISQSVFDSAAGEGVSTLTVFEREGERWKRTDAEVREYFHDQSDIEARLAAVGFDKPKVFDAADDFGMPRGDGRLFLLARRS
jgi:SAM-dependent methyltransferase